MSQCKAFTYFTVSKTANQSWSYYSDMSLTMGPQFCSQRGTNSQCGSNLSNYTKKSYSKVVSLTNWWKLDGQKYKNNFSTSFDKLILINFTDFKDQFWWETCIISWMEVLSFVLKAEHFTKMHEQLQNILIFFLPKLYSLVIHSNGTWCLKTSLHGKQLH